MTVVTLRDHPGGLTGEVTHCCWGHGGPAFPGLGPTRVMFYGHHVHVSNQAWNIARPPPGLAEQSGGVIRPVDERTVIALRSLLTSARPLRLVSGQGGGVGSRE